jgi:Flp pilus assembly protein CpaB
MRKWIPIAAAAAVFLFSLALLRPEPSRRVVVAAADLPAGWTIRESDVEIREVPQRLAPPDALSDLPAAAGKTLQVARARGDILRAAHLGAPIALSPDERAIGVKVSDASGLAGTLQPGDRVGVVAVVLESDRAFAKVTVEGLRVLYVDPAFAASVPEPPPAAAGGLSFSALRQRRGEGVVVLAVPTSPMPVLFRGPDGAEERRMVSALELLAALSEAQNARLSLYAAPPEARPFATSGLSLEDILPITSTQRLP